MGSEHQVKDLVDLVRRLCFWCGRHHESEEEEHEFHRRHHQVRALHLVQIEGETMLPITGIPLGTTKQFGVVTVPTGSVFEKGVVPAWTVNDVTLATVETPNSDPTGMTCKITGLADANVTVTISATRLDGKVVQGSGVVPVFTAQVTSMILGQLEV
jgi:predicted ThiF/HesA family dinucleotide-utilizing enzyme